MSKRIRSAKGEMVDFDILTIKAQIAAGHSLKALEPPKIEVKRQESFITKKTKRLASKAKSSIDKIATVDVAPKPTEDK